MALDNRGEYVGDMRYNTVPFEGGVMGALPVAVHPDGRIVFRDREGKDYPSFRGRTWDTIDYLAVNSAGDVGRMESPIRRPGGDISISLQPRTFLFRFDSTPGPVPCESQLPRRRVSRGPDGGAPTNHDHGDVK